MGRTLVQSGLDVWVAKSTLGRWTNRVIRTVVTYPRSCCREKSFESLAGQHPGAARRDAARRGAERRGAERCAECYPVSALSSRLVSVYLYAGTTYVPAERESGSIAGALSHTLSFSPSIGPERGHEKRLINRTNTRTFLPRDIERERVTEKEEKRENQ